MAQKDGINNAGVALVGGIGTLLLVVIVIGLQVVFYSMTDAEIARKESPVTSPELAAELTRQRERLTGYRVVDATKGIVTIPIDRAMDLVVRENRSADAKAGEVPVGK
jgi:hypothetical protein